MLPRQTKGQVDRRDRARCRNSESRTADPRTVTGVAREMTGDVKRPASLEWFKPETPAPRRRRRLYAEFFPGNQCSRLAAYAPDRAVRPYSGDPPAGGPSTPLS